MTPFVVVLPLVLAATAVAERATARVDSAPGIARAVFSTPEGKVTVHFPNDIRADDTLSGVVLAEPEGDNDKKRQKAQDRLSGYVVEMEGQQAKVSEGRARWRIPGGTGVVLRLLDPKGRELARTTLPYRVPQPHEFATLPGVVEDQPALVQQVKPTPLRSAPGSPPSSPVPDDFRLPSGGQTGRLVICDGPFDGDVATTTLTLGGEPVRLLAESPRQLVFESPVAAAGVSPLRLKERDVEVVSTYRSLAVALTAPTTQLLRGQSTTLGITVSGLMGLAEEVPLELQKEGVVSMSGGDQQVIVIKPSDVGPTGACSFERTLTAQQAGGFGVTATVTVPQTVIHLTAPANGTTLREPRPRFDWTVAHAPAGMTYAVKLVEGPPGLPLDDAVHGAPHHIGRDIAPTSWVYPADAPRLRPGASYAVVVKGIRDGAVVAMSGPDGFLFRPDDDPCAQLKLQIAALAAALAQARGEDIAGAAEQARADAKQCQDELVKARDALRAARTRADNWARNQRSDADRERAAQAAQQRDEAQAIVANLEARCAAAEKRQSELERAQASRPDDIKRQEQELEDLQRQLAECEARALQAERQREADRVQQEGDRAHEEARRKQDELARQKAIRRYQHLLDNIQKLGLRDAKDYAEYEKGFRGLWDDLPGVLAVMHGFAAEDVVGGTIPSDAITAVGQLAALGLQFVDPCQPNASGPRLLPKIREEINPDTGNRYDDHDALKKLEDMCQVLKDLEAIGAGRGPK